MLSTFVDCFFARVFRLLRFARVARALVFRQEELGQAYIKAVNSGVPTIFARK